MQPTRLLDNLNSDFIAAFSALSPKNAPQRVLVYVESDEDISFWRNILTPFESHKVRFDIQLPIKNGLEKGKLAVLKFADRVGKHLILCVDSDYDYLLQGKTNTSNLINSNNFIFQTYTYSIENLMCYASNLHDICVQASKNDTQLIDWVALMELYSQIIYKLFLWSVHFYHKGDTTSFPLTDFCNTIKIFGSPNVLERFATVLKDLKVRVDAKIQTLERAYPSEISLIEVLSGELQPLGLEKSTVYLFAQGHTIKDNVVLMFLKPTFQQLKNEKYEKIKEIVDTTEKENSRNQYTNLVKNAPIEMLLNNNTKYKTCFLYAKIEKDLTQYIHYFYSKI